MQTQCPHCDTKFRVTTTQVDAADGFVRCGICGEVFNAIEIAASHDYQKSLLNEVNTEPDDETLVDIDIDSVSEPVEPVDTGDFDRTDATDDSRKDAFDFFDEESNESLTHVVPEKYRDSYSSQTGNGLSTALWSMGALVLTATLILEYVWFNRNSLNQIPQVQSFMQALCQQVECTDLMMRNPSKIELVARNVYSHPDKNGALMVNVTMKNTAGFAQPLPVMQIDFSDIRGGIVAARRFYPAEYTALDTTDNLLQPAADTTVTLEISDPGKQATTYEFKFL